MPKGLRDIKTSTGAKAKRFLPPTINISVGRRIGTVRAGNRTRETGDWNGNVKDHLCRNIQERPPATITNWSQTFRREIERLEKEIAECKESVQEGIAGSKELRSQLEDRLAFFQEIFETF